MLHLKSNDYGPLMGNQWFTAPVILIISGMDLLLILINSYLDNFLAKISMVLGILGCVGAWFEKKALLFIVIKIFIFFLFLNIKHLFY